MQFETLLTRAKQSQIPHFVAVQFYIPHNEAGLIPHSEAVQGQKHPIGQSYYL